MPSLKLGCEETDLGQRKVRTGRRQDTITSDLSVQVIHTNIALSLNGTSMLTAIMAVASHQSLALSYNFSDKHNVYLALQIPLYRLFSHIVHHTVHHCPLLFPSRPSQSITVQAVWVLPAPDIMPPGFCCAWVLIPFPGYT